MLPSNLRDAETRKIGPAQSARPRIRNRNARTLKGCGAILIGVPNLRSSSLTRFSSKTPKRSKYPIAERSPIPPGIPLAKCAHETSLTANQI